MMQKSQFKQIAPLVLDPWFCGPMSHIYFFIENEGQVKRILLF